MVHRIPHTTKSLPRPSFAPLTRSFCLSRLCVCICNIYDRSRHPSLMNSSVLRDKHTHILSHHVSPLICVQWHSLFHPPEALQCHNNCIIYCLFETSVNWQVALTLQNSSLDVVPLVCLAAKTEMTLVTALRSFNNLQDRCRATILRHLANTVGTIDRLPVPRLMKNYIGELADVGGVEHSFRLERQHINCANRQSTNKRHRSPRMCLKNWPEEVTS